MEMLCARNDKGVFCERARVFRLALFIFGSIWDFSFAAKRICGWNEVWGVERETSMIRKVDVWIQMGCGRRNEIFLTDWKKNKLTWRWISQRWDFFTCFSIKAFRSHQGNPGTFTLRCFLAGSINPLPTLWLINDRNWFWCVKQKLKCCKRFLGKSSKSMRK